MPRRRRSAFFEVLLHVAFDGGGVRRVKVFFPGWWLVQGYYTVTEAEHIGHTIKGLVCIYLEIIMIPDIDSGQTIIIWSKKYKNALQI